MDVSGWSVDRRHRFHRFDVASFTVSKAFDRELWPSLWIVFGAQELGEFLIRRKDVVVNHFCDLIGQMFFVCVRKFRPGIFWWVQGTGSPRGCRRIGRATYRARAWAASVRLFRPGASPQWSVPAR